MLRENHLSDRLKKNAQCEERSPSKTLAKIKGALADGNEEGSTNEIGNQERIESPDSSRLLNIMKSILQKQGGP